MTPGNSLPGGYSTSSPMRSPSDRLLPPRRWQATGARASPRSGDAPSAERDPRADARAVTGQGVDRDGATHGCDARAHAREPGARCDRALVEAGAVIAHLQAQRAVLVGQLDD